MASVELDDPTLLVSFVPLCMYVCGQYVSPILSSPGILLQVMMAKGCVNQLLKPLLGCLHDVEWWNEIGTHCVGLLRIEYELGKMEAPYPFSSMRLLTLGLFLH